MSLPRASTRRAAAALVAAALALASPAGARDGDVPPRNQALLLLRVLAYDRNLRARAGDGVKVAVVFQPGDRASEERSAALRAAFEDVSRDVVVAGLPVKVEAVPFRDAADLDARLDAARPVLAYVDAGLARVVPDIVAVTRRRRILSADGSRALVEAGVSLGVVAAQSGRAGILVSVRASRAEGADLDAALLALAEVVRE